jgi:hypothetical protein
MNLTIITSGDGKHHLSAPDEEETNTPGHPRHSREAPAPSGEANNSALILTRPSKPIYSYPLIADFLNDLEEKVKADRPRNLRQYVDLLTHDDHLGYTRIQELIVACGCYTRTNPTITGADWLRERIHRTAAESKDASQDIRINEATANIIFQELLTVFERVEAGLQ